MNKINSKNFITASIIVWTFNQENFISECLNSILSQERTFKIEIIICDDASTDKTIDYLKTYEKKFADIIKLIIHQKNKWQEGVNFFPDVYKKCKGKYVFFIEGDDFWVGNNKLQSMVNFLEKNKHFVLVYHDFYRVDEEGKILSDEELNLLGIYAKRSLQRDYSQDDLQSFNFAYILVGSMCIRNLPLDFFEEYKLSPNPDMFYPMMLGKYGAAKYLESAGKLAYRVNSKGIWGGADKKERQRQKLLTAILMLSYFLRNKNYIKTLECFQPGSRLNNAVSGFINYFSQGK